MRRRVAAVAGRHVGLHQAGRDKCGVLGVRGDVGERAGVGRQRTAGRGLPGHGVGHRVVHDLAERVAVAIEDLEGLVDVVGQEEARHRGDRVGSAQLVDVGLGRGGGVGGEVGTRVDEAEQPAGSVLDAGAEADRRGPALELEVLGRGDRVDVEVEGPAEGVDDPQALDGQGAAEEGDRQARGGRLGLLTGGAALADDEAGERDPEQLLAQTVQ